MHSTHQKWFSHFNKLYGAFRMRKISVMLVLFMLSQNGFCEEIPDKALAIEYLRVSRLEQALNISIDTYSLQLSKNMPDEEKPQIKKFMQEVMGWDAIKDQLADLVVNLYTKDELNASIEFEKSPLGKSISDKNEQFSKQFAELLSQNMRQFAQKNFHRPSPSENPANP